MEIPHDTSEVLALLYVTLDESLHYGLAMNAAEAKYDTVKDLRVRELMDEGMSATSISNVIKGEPGVCDARHDFQDFKVRYANSCEAINVLKKTLDTYRDEIQRGWSQAGEDY